MSVRSWKGFIPEKAVVMVRRSSQPKDSPSVPVQQHSADSTDPVASIATITAQLKNALQQPRAESGPKSSVALGPQSTSERARVLVFLEGEPTKADRDFFLKMMAAIQVQEKDLVLEWGDFPEAKCPVVLGVGLSTKKSNRLSSLRPDRFELPALEAIQSDARTKRDAWELLKTISNKLKEFV
ncbi:MAG: hypothetical protein KGQ59_09225 [Bdellovibrionales bacterium]|nr:hypothetical protein [Bdellovibrionales bacterium]